MRVTIVVLLITVFSGCATAYQPKGFTGGYSVIKLGEKSFQITFDGNFSTSLERASDFSLLRSAEMALANGFRYFIIVDSENTYATGRGEISYGNYAYRSVTTRNYGREAPSNSAPTTTKTIHCYKERPEMNGLAFDAEFYTRSIKQKYQIGN